MYEPVLMSKKTFNRLDKKQQDVLLAAGKKAEAYFAKAKESRRRDGQGVQGP
jgi:TRAP-type C4-dicarboxylate transport system substrate-binding protein